MPYCLHPDTRLRPESETLLWFHRRTAETLELDAEGIDALGRLLQGKRNWRPRAWLFFQYLWAKGFLVQTSDAKLRQKHFEHLQDLNAQCQRMQSPLRSRSAPEVLQLSITDACQQSCSGCFFSNTDPQTPNRYMSPVTFERVLQDAIDNQVFQMAFGGGEPLMHPRLVSFVQATTEAGIVANLTSNGALLTDDMAKALAHAGLGQIQFSLNGADAQTHQQTRPHHDKVLAAIQTAKRHRLRWGLNILVTTAHLAEEAKALQALFAFAHAQGAAMVNLIRPKAAQDDAHWLAEHQPDASGHQQLAKIIQHWHKRAHFTLVTDTSYTFLRHPDFSIGKSKNSGVLSHILRQPHPTQQVERLRAAGVTGCSAGRQMLSVQVDGRYSPCSHLPGRFQANGDLQTLWQNSAQLKAFRELEETLEDECQHCELKSVCRGCRAVVLSEGRSFFGADHQCPKRLSTLS